MHSGSISSILKGLHKTSLSKKYNIRFKFEKNIKSKVYDKRYL